MRARVGALLLVALSLGCAHAPAKKYGWTPGWNTSGGGGGAGTVTTDATLTGIGSVGSPLHANAQFGPDTSVPMTNGSGVVIPNAGELVLTLTGLTGAEVPQWAVKLWAAGVQVTPVVFRPTGILAAACTASAPSYSFIAFPTTGFCSTTGNRIDVYSAGTNTHQFTSGGSFQQIFGGAFGYVDGAGFIRDGVTGKNLIVQAVTAGDVQIGATGALSTSATYGFLDIPGGAGPPTAAPANMLTGHNCLYFDQTNHVLYVYYGAWHVLATAI